MKRKKSEVDQRRAEVLEYLKIQPGTNIKNLSEKFQISVMTMRRDLQELEDMGLLIRHYGGARVRRDATLNDQAGYRNLIARYAASLVQDGDTLFLNTSKTALSMLPYINRQDVTVITNNGKAISTEHQLGVQVILTGGELRHPKDAMVGDYALRSLKTVYAKKSFIGCNGISAEMGVTTENANEVSINTLMVEHVTGESFVLADHTKLGRNSSFSSCPIGDVKNLITDELAPEDVLEELRAKGVKIHIVRKEDYK